jgi:hypothetical protein
MIQTQGQFQARRVLRWQTLWEQMNAHQPCLELKKEQTPGNSLPLAQVLCIRHCQTASGFAEHTATISLPRHPCWKLANTRTAANPAAGCYINQAST